MPYNIRKFIAPEIIFGNDSRKLAGQYCRNFMAKKALVVTDPGVIASGWTDDVVGSLSSAAIDYKLFSSVSPNPRTEEVMNGAYVYNEESCDIILAIGGGSPMDCAKGIGIVSSNGGNITDYKGIDEINEPVPPMIFIPTTAGTSADVSQFAIISDQKQLLKIAIVSKMIIPDVALVDPVTTVTMDPYLTACTGMDALVHAIEAFVSVASSAMTDIHALKAIDIISNNLENAVKNPDDIELRERIMFASMEAGLAFSNAILGAVHAMSHSLGGLLDLPHGECNSLLLEHVVNYNFSSSKDRFSKIAQVMGVNTKNLSSPEIKKVLFKKIKVFRESVGIKKTLKSAGVRFQDIPDLAEKSMKDACMLTNPREASADDIIAIFKEAM